MATVTTSFSAFGLPDHVSLQVSGGNDDQGVTYAIAGTDAYDRALQDIFDLGNTGESSFADYFSSLPVTLGGQSFGWAFNSGDWLVNNGPVYDPFETGDIISATVGVPESDLELNGSPGYQPFSLADVTDVSWNPAAFDPVIVRTDDALLELGSYTGNQRGLLATYSAGGTDFNNYSSQTFSFALVAPSEFTAIPEPASVFMLGAAFLAGSCLVRRRLR